MSLAIIDAREWQNVLDLRTGKKVGDDTPQIRLVKGLLSRHPYPGDTDIESNQWVSNTALDLLDKYDPQFIFLSYAQQYFSLRFTPLTEADRRRMFEAVFAEIERFSQESGFSTVVIGSGDMIPVIETIDLSRLDGLGVVSHWSTRYAGLYGLSSKDLTYIKNIAGIERVADREEVLSLFSAMADSTDRLPHYIAVAKEGYCFKSPLLRQAVMIPAVNEVIPLSASLGAVRSITDISSSIAAALKNRKVALIVLEGIGLKDFPFPYTTCTNGVDWYQYETGDAQYLAISKGEHQLLAYPAGYRSYLEDDENKEYPFSGYFTAIPSDTLGERFTGRSIAVGNRSMFMHTTTGADICVECFARNLYNQGCLAVIHRQDK